MKLEKILVIEDNKKHLEDAKKYLADKNVEVLYASTMQEAKELYKEEVQDMEAVDALNDQLDEGNINKDEYSKKYAKTIRYEARVDGIISDIYFPLTDTAPYDKPEPIGVQIALEAKQLGIPCVLNTAGYHHGTKYEWICQLARSQKWPLIDASQDRNKEADTKNWDRAWEKLQHEYNTNK